MGALMLKSVKSWGFLLFLLIMGCSGMNSTPGGNPAAGPTDVMGPKADVGEIEKHGSRLKNTEFRLQYGEGNAEILDRKAPPIPFYLSEPNNFSAKYLVAAGQLDPSCTYKPDCFLWTYNLQGAYVRLIITPNGKEIASAQFIDIPLTDQKDENMVPFNIEISKLALHEQDTLSFYYFEKCKDSVKGNETLLDCDTPPDFSSTLTPFDTKSLQGFHDMGSFKVMKMSAPPVVPSS